MIAYNYGLYTGPAGIRLSTLVMRKHQGSVVRSVSESSIYLTHRARTAISRACAMMRLGKGAKILAPSYNCGSEVDALLSCGATVELYKVDERARIDVEDLTRRIDGVTKMVYVTHFFGFPQPVDEIKKVCEKTGVFLVEDCALSLLSTFGGRRLGSFGDYAILNFPKWFPVPDGGVLVDNTAAPLAHPWPNRNPPALWVLRPLLPLIKSRTLEVFPRFRTFVELCQRQQRSEGREKISGADDTDRPEMPASYYFDERMRDLSISRLSRRMIENLDIDQIMSKRRANFLEYLRLLRDVDGVRPLYEDLPDGVCPLHFPVLVRDKRRVCMTLDRLFVHTIPWWAGYHPDFEWDLYPSACFLKDHVLALPLDHRKTERHVAFICRNLVNVVKNIS